MSRNKKPLILIVDDQEMNIDIAKKFLGDQYDYVTAISAEDAVKIILKNNSISLVLLDLVLPGISGFKLMEELKKCGITELPIIIMTADHDVKRESEGLRLGASDFIVKPLVKDILENRVQNVLSRQKEAIYETMLYKTEHDALTGLYNRKKMFDEARVLLKNHPGETFAFVRYDVDNFSLYNSIMGEEEGNRLLKTIADILRQMATECPDCVYGRIDADVFSLCEVYDKEVMNRHFAKARKLLEEYRQDYRLESSFGVCVFDDVDASIETIYTNASLAANKCKDQYDVDYAFYEDWMGESLKNQQEIKNEMVEALEKEQFVTYLQPKYDLHNDQPCGAEALVRWMHPTKGLVSPGQFIPVFEQNGFIAKLDYYMWENVCKILKKWKDKGERIYPISVNVSRISMYNLQLDQLLLGLIHKYELEPELLELEVTESAYMSNTELMKESIERLQTAGFKILMDDFGSGYSSLNTLKDIHVDVLKIDIKFLPNGVDNERSEKILSSVVRMAGWLGMPVIAEGVEIEEQRNFLRDIGCEYVQGYFYARPMPVEEYEEVIKNGPAIFDKKKTPKYSSAAWSSDSKVNDIMGAIELPIAIIEHSSMQTHIVRVNKYYTQQFGSTSELSITAFSKERLVYAIDDAEKKGVSEVDLKYIVPTGEERLINVKVKCIEKTSKASLVCCVATDVTNEKRYEAQLSKLTKMLPAGERTKMLVADDSKLSRELLQKLFADRYDILTAADGKEAIQLFYHYEQEIAVVLLDLHMPKMDGREFLLKKNALGTADNIPVIVISSDSALEVQYDMLALGVMDYYSKPFDSRILKAKVQNAIMYAERYQNLRKEFIESAKE